MNPISVGWRRDLLIPAILLFTSLSQSLGLSAPQAVRRESARLFAYHPVGFDLKEESVKEQDGVIIRDVNYAAYSPQRGRIKAFLIKPAGKGPFAGLLFFHWLGKPNGDRTQFREEAVALAKQGAVSLLLQGYFPWAVEPIDGSTDRQRVIDETIEVRRALDLLLSQPQVDHKRVGFVGHDYGSMYGAIASGVEQRVKTWVLISGVPTFSEWSLKYWPGTAAKGEETYRKTMADLEPINYVAHAAPAKLLFQFSNTDKYISKSTATRYFEAASGPKEIRWYDSDHALNVASARSDRREWLTRQLGLAK